MGNYIQGSRLIAVRTFIVIMLRIGQSAVYFLSPILVGYERPSTTERVLVNNDDLANLNLLKIQSAPLGNLGDQAFDGDKAFCLKQQAAFIVSR